LNPHFRMAAVFDCSDCSPIGESPGISIVAALGAHSDSSRAAFLVPARVRSNDGCSRDALKPEAMDDIADEVVLPLPNAMATSRILTSAAAPSPATDQFSNRLVFSRVPIFAGRAQGFYEISVQRECDYYCAATALVSVFDPQLAGAP